VKAANKDVSPGLFSKATQTHRAFLEEHSLMQWKQKNTITLLWAAALSNQSILWSKNNQSVFQKLL